MEDPAGVELAGWTEGRVGRQTTQTRQLVDAQVGQQRGPNHTHNNWARLAVEERADMWAPIFSSFATTRSRDFNTKFLLLKLYETFRCTLHRTGPVVYKHWARLAVKERQTFSKVFDLKDKQNPLRTHSDSVYSL